MITRRRWLLSSTATAYLTGCADPTRDWKRSPALRRNPNAKPVVDVHCHVFNGSDLSIYGYVRAMINERWNSSLLGHLLPLYPAQLWYSAASMGAEAEYDLLSTTAPGEPLHDLFYRQKRHNQPSADIWRNIGHNLGWASAHQPAAPDRARPPPVLSDAGTEDGSPDAAFRFLGYVAKPRATLALILDENSRREAGAPVLLTPALVDMWNWVHGYDTRPGWVVGWLNRQVAGRLSRGFEGLTGIATRTTSVREQMRVMKVLAERRPDGLLVHPFVPYDPWRGAVHLASGRADEALREVREAILAQGAVGVKLYPPMGFRATSNVGLRAEDFRIEFRDAIKKRQPGNDHPGYWLDEALSGLYAWCSANAVPVMAHTGPSHAGNGEPEYLCRAEPCYWRPALQKHTGLRVNLGHFGGIWRWSATKDNPARRLNCHAVDEWPVQVYKLLADPELAGRVFADMADVPLRPSDPGTSELVSKVKERFGDAPAIKRGLMYGSDFPFTVLEGASVDYRRDFEDTLTARTRFGFSEEETDDIMWRNASRFLGLTRDGLNGAKGETAKRLVEFHRQAILNEAVRRQSPSVIESEVDALLTPFLVPPSAAPVRTPPPRVAARTGGKLPIAAAPPLFPDARETGRNPIEQPQVMTR